MRSRLDVEMGSMCGGMITSQHDHDEMRGEMLVRLTVVGD